MKFFLIILGLALAVAEEPIVLNYHEQYGIPEATRIKQAEEAKDFDGSRIVGGQVSALGQHPHMGGLLIDLVDNRVSMCGASLMSYTRLLTAAHCWTSGSIQARQFTVVLGSTNLFTGGTRVATSDVELHANYNGFNLNNDIAIIRIPHVPYTNIVLRILLPSGGDYAGTWATATGYGRTSGSPTAQNELQRHVNLQVITNAACASVYGPSVVISSTLCTATTTSTSTCFGDSGGPLAVGVGATRELIGVAAFVSGLGCNSGSPAGFTRVSSYLDWIRARL